jgi:CheY-like chemotaxis protein
MGKKGGVLEVGLRNMDFNSEAVTKFPDLTRGRYLMLTVRDTGQGMDRSILQRIFDPYFTTKEKHVGTGLGLAVVHGITKSHGGSITVQSELGKGSIFNIFFPVVELDIKTVTEDLEPHPTGNERILFIDDEDVIADLGRRMLQHLGYGVITRTSSIEALEAFRAQPDNFDLVITDQTMPNMTGEDLAKELMIIRPNIPIILCTGFSEGITEEKVKSGGIRALVMKPIALRDIAQAVRRVLDQKIDD